MASSNEQGCSRPQRAVRLPTMRDVFILLGHVLTAIAKILRPAGARAIVAGYSSCRGLPDWQFAMHRHVSIRQVFPGLPRGHVAISAQENLMNRKQAQ